MDFKSLSVAFSLTLIASTASAYVFDGDETHSQYWRREQEMQRRLKAESYQPRYAPVNYTDSTDNDIFDDAPAQRRKPVIHRERSERASRKKSSVRNEPPRLGTAKKKKSTRETQADSEFETPLPPRRPRNVVAERRSASLGTAPSAPASAVIVKPAPAKRAEAKPAPVRAETREVQCAHTRDEALATPRIRRAMNGNDPYTTWQGPWTAWVKVEPNGQGTLFNPKDSSTTKGLVKLCADKEDKLFIYINGVSRYFDDAQLTKIRLSSADAPNDLYEFTRPVR